MRRATAAPSAVLDERTVGRLSARCSCAEIALAFLSLPIVALFTQVPLDHVPHLLTEPAARDALIVTARTTAIANALFLLIGTLDVYLRELLTDAAEVDESSIGGIQPGTGGRGAGGKAIVVAIAIEDCGETAGRPGDQALLVDNVRGPVDAIAATLEQGATRAGPGRSLTSVSGVRATRTFARCASRMPRPRRAAADASRTTRQPARLPGVKAGRIVGPRRRAAPRDVRHATPEGSAMGVTFA